MSEVGNVAVDDMKTTIHNFFSVFFSIQGGINFKIFRVIIQLYSEEF